MGGKFWNLFRFIKLFSCPKLKEFLSIEFTIQLFSKRIKVAPSTLFTLHYTVRSSYWIHTTFYYVTLHYTTWYSLCQSHSITPTLHTTWYSLCQSPSMPRCFMSAVSGGTEEGERGGQEKEIGQTGEIEIDLARQNPIRCGSQSIYLLTLTFLSWSNPYKQWYGITDI